MKLAQPSNLKLADNSLALVITYCAQVYFKLGNYYNEIWYFVTSLSKFNFILRILWLKQHDSKLFFRKKTLIFDSKFCKSKYLLYGKLCTMNNCSSRKNKIKSNSLTQRARKDSLDSRHF